MLLTATLLKRPLRGRILWSVRSRSTRYGDQTIQALTESERTAIRENLFPAAWGIVDELPTGAWHRDRSKLVTASRVQSSQALALDVFGTLKTLSSGSTVARAWSESLALPDFGQVVFGVEKVLEPSLLGESRSTQVDATVMGAAACALFECKFTEPDGGSCSQTTPIALKDGTKSPQCNGRYEQQRNPLTGSVHRCALSAKGIRYWDLAPAVLRVSSDTDYDPCPFAGVHISGCATW